MDRLACLYRRQQLRPLILHLINRGSDAVGRHLVGRMRDQQSFAFFENVDRGGKNAVLKFEPQPPQVMNVACLYSRVPGDDGFYSFAAITDEPLEEVSAAGHDRCVINIKAENIDAWLTPEGRSAAELQNMLSDVERPRYEYEEQVAA